MIHGVKMIAKKALLLLRIEPWFGVSYLAIATMIIKTIMIQ
jgi:hypothetical protein